MDLKESQHKHLRTRSELDRKSKKIIDEEKDTIKKIIKKSESTRMPEHKWEDLTNKEKFVMDYLTYQKKKNLGKI